MSLILDGTAGVTFPNSTTQAGAVSQPAAPFTVNGVVHASSTSALTTRTGLQFDGNVLSVIATGGSTSAPNTALIVDYESGGALTTGGGTAIELRGNSSGGGVANYQQARIRSIAQPTNNAHGLAFDYRPNAGTALTEVMRIDTNGRVGIGTTSPSGQFEVGSAGYTNAIFSSTGAGYYSQLTCSSYTGGGGLVTVALISDGGSAFGRLSTGTAHPLVFGTVATEAMRIDTSQNLLVGTTTLTGGKINAVNSSGLWIQKLQDAASNGSMIQFLTPAGSQAGSITISGSTTSYGSGSDYRLKEQIKPLENALSKVNQLKPVSWVWKTEQTNGQGFIAHELAEIIPDCVIGEKDAIDENGDIKPQMVDTSFLVATLTSAIQELSALVTAQSATITSLTESIVALENKIV